MSRRGRWRVDLSTPAQADIEGILRHTAERFGAAQARRYEGLVAAALVRLRGGPDAPGVRRRDDLSAGIRLLHIGQRGRSARHFVVFRVVEDHGKSIIRVLRVLYDAMDLARHVGDADDEATGE
jgi:plasmid stabilization system protein ParE